MLSREIVKGRAGNRLCLLLILSLLGRGFYYYRDWSARDNQRVLGMITYLNGIIMANEVREGYDEMAA